MGAGREQGRSPRVVCVSAPPSSFAKLTFGLAVLLGPRVVPLKVRSSPLCLCFLSGLSFCASWWEPPARALRKTSRLLIGTPGPTLTSAVGGWAQLGAGGHHSQEQEMPTLPFPPLLTSPSLLPPPLPLSPPSPHPHILLDVRVAQGMAAGISGATPALPTPTSWYFQPEEL